jgi:hypothetical protein
MLPMRTSIAGGQAGYAHVEMAGTLEIVTAYVDVMIADRCRKPGTDLLSQLIATGFDGEDLTVDELHAVVRALVSGASRETVFQHEKRVRPCRNTVSAESPSPCTPSRA